MTRSALTSTLLSASIALALSTPASATERAPNSQTATYAGNVVAHPAPSGGPVTLLDQTASPGTNGVLAMRNLDPGSEIYDSEMADDFQVPAGGWAVSQVSVGSFYQGKGPVTPSTVGNITFYNNVAGAPGAAVSGCTYTGIALSYNSVTGYSTLNLPTACALAAGTYWMAFSGDLSFQAEFGGVFVLQQTTTTGISAVWRNPADAFGSGCSAWTAITSCSFSAGDMTFLLSGQTTPVSLQSFGID